MAIDFPDFYNFVVANQAKWVKSCHAECVYAQIPADTESYFLPKKPGVPANFVHKCEGCGHEDTYQRNDPSYRDETMPSRVHAKKCGGSDRALGFAK